MTEQYKKLKATLETMFQLDQPDLDFGIYRIMNQKREEVTDFLNNRLLKQVKETLSQAAGSDRDQLKKELDEKVKTVRELGYDPVENPMVRELQAKYQTAASPEAMENEVYSHLTNFFRRYYHQGDFISQRRYKEGVYAIPYEGEEVKLHWANHDQYYIKTSEYFKNYRFELPNGKKVNFELLEASTEQNNNKTQNNKERRFKLAEETVFDEEGNELKIFFTYEPTDKKQKQDDLMAAAFEQLKKELPQAWLQELLRPKPTEKNKTRTLLEKHLKDYTARNTFDYFIHKDLGGFLRRELDFYIKNEILHLDDINLDSEQDFQKQLLLIKALKGVAQKIIDFLAQLEDFQKKLWLKKKFVLQSDYCITLDRIDESFYVDIAASEAQRQEWVKLFAIDELKDYSEPLTQDFLKNNPYLVVDTQFFDRSWKYNLLGTLDRLDEHTDGLLVNSENFQALNLLNERFREQVVCTYIDPPYNTGDDGFNYKDNYKSSSWLSMMNQTLPFCVKLLREDGAFFSSCDEHEALDFGQILKAQFGTDNFVESITWNKRVPKNDKGIGNIHEYIYLFAKNQKYRRSLEKSFQMRKDAIEDIYKVVEKLKRNNVPLKKAKSELKKYYKKQGFDRGITLYCELDQNYEIWGKINMSWPNAKTEGPRYEVINPATEKPAPVPNRGWRWKEDTLKDARKNGERQELPDGSIMEGRIWFSADEKTQPSSITYLKEVESFLLRSIISLKSDGSIQLDNLGLSGTVDYPKPPKLLEWIFYSPGEISGWFLDFFAGSGTTSEAILRLNSLDNGQRKYLQIDMGQHFWTALKPRTQKVVYSENWNGGKPQDFKGSSHCFKYLRLESYEDTLNNLRLRQTEQQAQMLGNENFEEEYRLHYMLEVESRESLLSTNMFKKPFGYTIKSIEHNEIKEVEVDLVETFNYLIGLVVDSIQVIKDYVVVIGDNLEGEHIAVIWRDVQKQDNQALNEFFRKTQINPRDTEFDRIYVNGDNNLENLKTAEDKWKVVLIEEEFHKRMFEEGGL